VGVARRLSLLKAGAAFLLAAVVLGACWGAFSFVAHHLPWRASAPRLWTEKDLPPLPDERDNGFLLIAARTANPNDHEFPVELREVLDHLEWARAKALAERIHEFVVDPGVRVEGEVAHAAFASRRFADACSLALEARRCRPKEVVRFHDLVALGVLDHALKGDFREAFLGTDRLLRADLDLAHTSRKADSELMAQRDLGESLSLAGVLVDGIETEAPARLVPVRGELASIATLLDSAAAPVTDAKRLVIAEYVYVTLAIRTFCDRARSKFGSSALVLDEENTIALENTYFEPLMRFAENPSTGEAPTLSAFSADHFGWWAYNAVGKRLLDGVLLDLAPMIKVMDKKNGQIEVARRALRERLRVLLQRVPEK
jgi:hypothetical protein